MSAIRELARWVKHAPDRWLHPRRRAAATERLTREPPGSIAFVCHGNICRSPYAEVALTSRLPGELLERIRVTSAGFIGPGRPSPPEAVEAAKARGHDLTRHRATGIWAGEVEGADVVIVMDTRQRRALRRMLGRSSDDILLLGDLDPEPIVRRVVMDPVQRPLSVFHEVYGRIDRCVDNLADHLIRGHRREMERLDGGRGSERRTDRPEREVAQ